MTKIKSVQNNKIEHIWTTRDGRKILVEEMGDTHLLNTIHFLERQAAAVENAADSWFGACFQGEMAEMATDQMGDMCDAHALGLRQWLGIMKNEMRTRALSNPFKRNKME